MMHAFPRTRVAMAMAVALLMPSSLLAGGALKITMVRTHDSNGDMVFGVMPNATNLVLDGGGSIQPTGKGQVFLDNAVGSGGTISYMALSHAHTDHYDGLKPTLDRYVVQRYYSSFPEDDSPAESIGTTAYSQFTSKLNTEFSAPYTTNANCFEIVATGTPSTTAKVSGSGTNLGPGWDSNVDVLVVSGEEMSSSGGCNSNSVTYHVWYGSNTYLLGGDATGPGSAETNVESTLITNYGGSGNRIYQNVGLFKMQHHGANTSNGTALLDEIQPTNQLRRYSFVCEGDTNTTSNFTTAAMGRVKDHGRAVYRSGLDGAARFASVGSGELSIIRQYTYSEGGTQSHGWDFAPPNAPASPAGSVSGSNVSLSWSSPTTPSGTSLQAYDIFRGTVSGGIAIPLATGEDPGSSFWRTGSVTGLYTKIARVAAPGTTYQDAPGNGTYYYRVRALHDYYYESEYSSEVSVVMDATAPAAVTDLTAAKGTNKGEAKLDWTAPGDDGASGTATTYVVRYATYSITDGNWSQATDATGEPAPAVAGTRQTLTVGNLAVGATYYFALKTQDEVPNTSGLSNVPSSRAKGYTNPGHVVISEIQVGGGTATDEFVELFNPTASSVDMTNWRLSKKTSGGTQSNLLTTFGAWSIAPGGYFLIAHANYDGAVTKDQAYSTANSIAADNTVILYSDQGTTVADKVGFGTAVDSETATIANPGTDGSVERKPGASAPSDGNGEDTDNNSADLAQRTTSDPQNASSPTEMAPAKPRTDEVYEEDLSDLGPPKAFALGPNPIVGGGGPSVYFVTGWSAFNVDCRIYNATGELVLGLDGAGSAAARRVGHGSPAYQRGRYALAISGANDSGRPLASGVYLMRLRVVNPETGETVPHTRKFVVIR